MADFFENQHMKSLINMIKSHKKIFEKHDITTSYKNKIFCVKADTKELVKFEITPPRNDNTFGLKILQTQEVKYDNTDFTMKQFKEDLETLQSILETLKPNKTYSAGKRSTKKGKRSTKKGKRSTKKGGKISKRTRTLRNKNNKKKRIGGNIRKIIRVLATCIFSLSIYGTVLACTDDKMLPILWYSLLGIVASCFLCASTFSVQTTNDGARVVADDTTEEDQERQNNNPRERLQVYTQVAIAETPNIRVLDDIIMNAYDLIVSAINNPDSTNQDEPDIENQAIHYASQFMDEMRNAVDTSSSATENSVIIPPPQLIEVVAHRIQSNATHAIRVQILPLGSQGVSSNPASASASSATKGS
jgi:hypothetical protein